MGVEEEKVEILTSKPENFSTDVEAVSCYLEVNGQYLLLQRSEEESYKDLWSVPSGSIEREESVYDALQREVQEETGIEIGIGEAEKVGCLYFRHPSISIVFHIFRVLREEVPKVVLNFEHQDYQWVSFAKASQVLFMPGGYEMLELYRQLVNGGSC